MIGFVDFIVMSVKGTVFWDIIPLSPVNLYQTIRRYISDCSNLNIEMLPCSIEYAYIF
jgi:hypothetical protein